MTERERVEALLKRQKPDRVPILPFASAIGFSGLYNKLSIAEAYNSPEKTLAAQRKTARDFGWAIIPFFSYASFGGWEFGGDIKWPSSEFSQAPMITRRPLETADDVWKLKKPDLTTAGIIPLQIKFYQLSFKDDLDNEPFNIIAFVGGPVTLAANLCGIDNLGKWSIKNKEVVHHLLRITTEHSIELASYLKSLFGTDRVLPFCGEATTDNRIISPKFFEQFALPYNKELQEAMLSMGFRHLFCHICGEQNANLPYWAKIPMGDPGIISIGHEIPLSKAAQYFPSDIIMGNLEPAIIQAKTAEEVYKATRTVVEEGMKITGGYIFSPGCDVPPLSPVDNMKAMTKAVNDYGWYK